MCFHTGRCSVKVNVTMLARGREKLTLQSVRSLRDATCNSECLEDVTILDDAGEPPVNHGIWAHCMETDIIRNQIATGGAGPARNQVIRAVKNRADLLYLSDNDVFFVKGWLDILTELWPQAHALGFRVIGAYQHPYNRSSLGAWPFYSDAARKTIVLHETLAVATQSWLMDWETWDRYGPFAEAPGVRQSEDVDMCNRIRADGGKVGFVWPPCVLNASLTDTFGKEVPGAELLRGEMQDGIVYE